MDTLSSIDKSSIVEFVQKERKENPDWFLVTSAKNFASPAELIVYFSAFCMALQHANKALTEIDKLLRRVKSIFSTWKGIPSEKPVSGVKSKGVRLKLEEKVIIVIYRFMCSASGGARKEQIVQSLGVSMDEVEPILEQLLTKGILSRSQRTERWYLSIGE